MYFAGDNSKFDDGEQVYYKSPDSDDAVPCTIKSVGVLGGKLSNHIFLYEIVLSDGKCLKVTESVLTKEK